MVRFMQSAFPDVFADFHFYIRHANYCYSSFINQFNFEVSESICIILILSLSIIFNILLISFPGPFPIVIPFVNIYLHDKSRHAMIIKCNKCHA